MCQLCVCTKGWVRISYLQMLLHVFKCPSIPFCRMSFKGGFCSRYNSTYIKVDNKNESFYSVRQLYRKLGLILKLPLNILSKNMLLHV